MTTAKEHGRIVLAGIIPARIDLLQEAVKELTPEHFVDSTQSNLFNFLLYFYDKSDGGVLTSLGLRDVLNASGFDAGRRAIYEETYEDLKLYHPDDTDVVWSMLQLREERAESEMKAALTDSMEIVTKGLDDGKGNILKGQEAARDFLFNKLSEIDDSIGAQSVPHGDLRDETSIVAQEYLANKKARAEGRTTGVQFGIRALDEKVDGIQRGDLALLAAYTNDGKTSLAIQLAWSTAVEQGKNVLFLCTETVNTTVRRRLVSRHSVHPKFQDFGLPDGLNSKDFKASTFNAHEEELLAEVLNDLKFSDYGHMYVHQAPRNASMLDIEKIMYDVQKTKFDIDLVICDTLQLLKPIGRRDTDRESLSGLLKSAKQVSVSFNKGRGVGFVSPWQVNRAAKESADNIGRYSSSAMADTAEATNTPDLIVSILAPQENTERKTTLVAQVLKHRDGETADGIQLRVDYATCEFASQGTLESFNNASFNSGGGIDGYI